MRNGLPPPCPPSPFSLLPAVPIPFPPPLLLPHKQRTYNFPPLSGRTPSSKRCTRVGQPGRACTAIGSRPFHAGSLGRHANPPPLEPLRAFLFCLLRNTGPHFAAIMRPHGVVPLLSPVLVWHKTLCMGLPEAPEPPPTHTSSPTRALFMHDRLARVPGPMPALPGLSCSPPRASTMNELPFRAASCAAAVTPDGPRDLGASTPERPLDSSPNPLSVLLKQHQLNHRSPLKNLALPPSLLWR